VLTHRFLENPYGVTFIHGDIKDIIDQSKNVAKKNIWLVGGSSIIEQCMKSNLIDRYIITIIPTLLGDGIQLFKNINQTKKLNQIGTYTLKDCIEVEFINA
jgi:dihydrofolate reductase